MRGHLSLLSTLAVLSSMLALPAAAKDPCASIDAATASGWFDQWNLALASLSADRVVERYWQDAVLLPTLSNTPRTTPAMIRDYFEHFLQQHPRGRIDTRTLHLGCNLAIDMGTYTFALIDDDGHASETAARYTFIYEYRRGAWKILHHHSSAMPEDVDSEGSKSSKRSTRKGGGAKDGSGKPLVVGGSQPFLNADNSPNVAQFYPPEARARGEQGSVFMQVCTGPNGELNRTPEILESSGSAELDAAAKEWATAARWIPATRQSAAVEGCTRVRVEFSLG